MCVCVCVCVCLRPPYSLPFLSFFCHDRNVADLDVALGDHRQTQANPNRQIINVDRVVDHENYDSEAISDDISLLHLETPAVLNNFVQPACKPDRRISYEAFKGTVSGWGRIRRSKSSAILVLKLKYKELKSCQIK